MPELTPPRVVDAVRRQILRVRRRRNLYHAQRALYLAVAAAAGTATTLLLLALLAGPTAFAVAVWAGSGGLLLFVAALSHRTARGWLRTDRAAVWIDRETEQRGRIATLIELEDTGRPRTALGPLLEDENARRLSTWEPARVLPEGVPIAALHGALVASAALLLALAFAPHIDPPPEPAASPGSPAASPPRMQAVRRRLLSAPRPGAADQPVSALREDAEGSVLARLPAELRERIQRRLWGEQRERQSMARAGEPPPGAARREGGEAGRHGQSSRPTVGDDSERPTEAGDSEAQEAEGRAARAELPPRDRAAPGRGAPTAGAGTGTDRNLLGPPSTPGERAARARFRLAIAARVRALEGGPQRPSGEAPPPEPDERPELGARQLRDAPVHRLDVPPAYEGIVRRVFAREEVP
jgi:hypothetical protein